MGIKNDERLSAAAMPRMGLMNDLARFGVKFDKPGEPGSDPAPADPAPADDPKPAEDPAPADDPKPAEDPKPDAKVDDEKAALLKDLMKKKDKLKDAEAKAADESKAKQTAEEQLAKVNERIAKALGVESVDQLDDRIAQLEKDEESRLAAAGEWTKLKERLLSEHKKELEQVQGTKDQQIGDLTKKNEAAESEIRRLLVTNTFAASGFINEDLNLSAAHAERLFGEHFKIEADDAGKRTVKAYNAKGEPLVDSEGNALSFDDALKEIVNADPDKDRLFKTKAKPGSGSGAKGTGAEPPAPDNVRGSTRIAAALAGKK